MGKENNSNRRDSKTRDVPTNFPLAISQPSHQRWQDGFLLRKLLRISPVPKMEIPQIIRVKILKTLKCRRAHGNTI